MRNVNQRRKYAKITWTGGDKNTDFVLGMALHVAADRWSEAMGCTLKTGGEMDLVSANYELKQQMREAKRRQYIKRKALSSSVATVQASIGTVNK